MNINSVLKLYGVNKSDLSPDKQKEINGFFGKYMKLTKEFKKSDDEKRDAIQAEITQLETDLIDYISELSVDIEQKRLEKEQDEENVRKVKEEAERQAAEEAEKAKKKKGFRFLFIGRDDDEN